MFSIAVYANGEFVVLHSPDSVSFHVKEEIEQSVLKEVLADCLGLIAKQVHFYSLIFITMLFYFIYFNDYYCREEPGKVSLLPIHFRYQKLSLVLR